MKIKQIVVGELAANCYLLIDGGELAIIDPGNDALRIGKEIADTSVIPKFIINTHSHFDHIGADNELKKLFRAQILIGDKEKNYIDFNPDGFLEDGQILKIGSGSLKVVNTPGHTKGGICLFGDNFVVSGDTIFKDGIGRTDLPGGSIEDMAQSLKKLDQLIPEGMMVYPGHGEAFNYKKGNYLSWI